MDKKEALEEIKKGGNVFWSEDHAEKILEPFDVGFTAEGISKERKKLTPKYSDEVEVVPNDRLVEKLCSEYDVGMPRSGKIGKGFRAREIVNKGVDKLDEVI